MIGIMAAGVMADGAAVMSLPVDTVDGVAADTAVAGAAVTVDGMAAADMVVADIPSRTRAVVDTIAADLTASNFTRTIV
jgi:hypothetical protein